MFKKLNLLKSYIKDKKSIRFFFYYKLLYSTIFIIILIIFSFDTFIELNNYYQLIVNSTKIFQIINSFFSKKELNPKIFELLQKYYNIDYLKKYYNERDEKKIELELRNITSYLRDKREKDLIHLIKHFKILFIISITLLTILVISNIYSFKLLKSFSNYANNLINNLKNFLINFNINIIDKNNPIYNFQEVKNLCINISNLNIVLDSLKKAIEMNPTLSLEQFIDYFGEIVCSDEIKPIFKCDRFSLAIYERETDNLIAYHAYKTDIKNIKLKAGFTQKLSDTSLKDMIKEKKEFRIIDDLTKINSESSKLLLDEGILSNLTIPIIINDRLYGFLFFASKEKKAFTEENFTIGLIFSKIVKYRFFYSYAIQDNIKTLGDSVVNIVEFKDEETYNHTIRVSLYSDLIADYLAEKEIISPQKAREIRDFAPLHDIGKVGIPDHILLKPGKLTKEEFEIIKTHPIIGAKIIDSSNEKIYGDIGYKLLDTAFNIIYEHHENWNGSGYPLGKKGEEISIEARIVAIADVFDALTTKRPYKDPIPFEESLNILNSQSGIKFDPYLIKIFNEKIDIVKDIYEKLKD